MSVSKATNSDALTLACGSRGDGISVISQLADPLNSNRSEVRAIAAYALQEISELLSEEMFSFDILDLRNPYHRQIFDNFGRVEEILAQRRSLENDLDVLRTLSIGAESPSCLVNEDGEEECLEFLRTLYVRRDVENHTRASSPIVCRLPGIRSVFPRC